MRFVSNEEPSCSPIALFERRTFCLLFCRAFLRSRFCKLLIYFRERTPMFITSSRHAYDVLKKHTRFDVEEMWVIALNSQLKMIDLQMLFRGTVDQCHVHPRDIFRFVCLQNASSFIIAHNHPSQDTEPSQEDIELTQKIFNLAQMMEIRLLDHLILSEKTYSSMSEDGILKKLSNCTLI